MGLAITDAERRLENQNAKRVIPLHPELIQLGFLAHVEKVGPKPSDPIFPDLKPKGRDEKRGHAISKWFGEYRKAIGLLRRVSRTTPSATPRTPACATWCMGSGCGTWSSCSATPGAAGRAAPGMTRARASKPRRRRWPCCGIPRWTCRTSTLPTTRRQQLGSIGAGMDKAPQPDRAEWFLAEIVRPTVNEFMAAQGDLRRGLLSAIVLSHAADHVFHARPTLRRTFKDERAYREALAARSEGFALIRDVADAAKHAKLSRRSSSIPGADAVVSSCLLQLRFIPGVG